MFAEPQKQPWEQSLKAIGLNYLLYTHQETSQKCKCNQWSSQQLTSSNYLLEEDELSQLQLKSYHVNKRPGQQPLPSLLPGFPNQPDMPRVYTTPAKRAHPQEPSSWHAA